MHIGQKIAKALGIKGKRISVKMKGTKELSNFIRAFKKAQESSKDSTTRYGIA